MYLHHGYFELELISHPIFVHQVLGHVQREIHGRVHEGLGEASVIIYRQPDIRAELDTNHNQCRVFSTWMFPT